jgi:hypothetical protein
MPEPFSTAHLDYLQRVHVNLAGISAQTPVTSAPPDYRRMWHVQGVGCIDKRLEVRRTASGRLASEDAITGLYGLRIPIAFLIRGTAEGVEIRVGIWSPQNRESVSPSTLDLRRDVLKSTLSSLYPAIELTAGEVSLNDLRLGGIVLGVPTYKPPDPNDKALAVDRLIRALGGSNWASLILAQPVNESVAADLRNSVLCETRVVQAAEQADKSPSPLATYYAKLLDTASKNLHAGLEVGLWRTAVYLMGDEESYFRLESVWRGVFSGPKSIPEPLRVWHTNEASRLAANWALPDTEGSPGPGNFRYPLEYQTLLNSTQLSAYIHLPQLETSGFTLRAVPDFDVVPQSVGADKAISLGPVLERTRPTKTPYQIRLNDLTRHTFVAGVTGGGKTNTVFNLLKQAAQLGSPFLVLEPAKTEYRALVDDKTLRGSLQVFTLGDELTSPFRLNPFEVVSWPAVPVGLHLDLLRSAFTASFGMWSPLPQILERCLHAVYEDRGWDITTNANHRLDSKSDVADAFPTLAELAAKADEIIQKLGYEAKITDDMRAALLTRLNGLRVGGKGSMLDVQRSLPMEMLLTRPTVLELQNMGDDDDKALVMGLLLIRLYEYRRAGNEVTNLQHIVVIEEAHRLLANTGARRDEEEGDPRAKAVESFSNLLSEIRAYGQGVIVADQVPVKLAPDIIKNTNLKIAHRLVASDDRSAMAGAMAMDEKKARALATLNIGQAAIFSTGDDAPVLVEVPKAKDYEGTAPPTNERLRDYMSSCEAVKPYKALFQSLSPDVVMSHPAAYRDRDAARTLAEDPTFRRDFVRLVISITEDNGALARLWSDLIGRAQAARRDGMDEATMLRALIIYASAWFTRRRGSQAGWSYADTGELEEKLGSVLLAKLEGKDALQWLESFREVMHRLHARRFEPFVGCAKVCTQSPPVCLYRRAVSDYIAQSKVGLADLWDRESQNGSTPEERLQNTWAASDSVSFELIEGHEAQADATRRIRLCFEQHMLSAQFREVHDGVLQRLLDAYAAPTDGGEKNAG